jgi:hypothetical protein
MENWDDDDFIVPDLSSNTSKKSKVLEERILMEESEASLIKDLFSNEQIQENNRIIIEPIITKQKKINIVKNNKLNELKQKELSVKKKENIKKKQRDIEIFGENDYYSQYTEFEDKIYN